MCYGPDYEERRHAAFCGLLLLDQLDIMQSQKEAIGDKSCSISLKYYSVNLPLLRLILQNWNKIKSVFGAEFLNRINRYGGEDIYAWENLCVLADAYPHVKQEAIDFINSTVESGKQLTTAVLAFVSRVCPRSELLSKCCLDILLHDQRHGDRVGYDQIFLAAKLLGQNFESNQEILVILSEHLRDNYVPTPILLALAYGWQQSHEFEKSLDIISEQKTQLDYGLYIKLCCLRKGSQDVLKMITNLLKDFEKDVTLANILDSRYVSDSIISRLREDEDLRDMLIGKILNNPTPSEKASLPRLLFAAQGFCQKLTDWSIQELNYQTCVCPEVGADLLESKLMPVSLSLLSILKQ